MKQTPYYVTDEVSRRDEYPAATICRSGVDGGVWNLLLQISFQLQRLAGGSLRLHSRC
jgi:hypothetical protein